MRQQLDSFDEFIQMSVQRIVEESQQIELEAETSYREQDQEPPVSIEFPVGIPSHTFHLLNETLSRFLIFSVFKVYWQNTFTILVR